jgi:acyl carrier protein
LEPHDVGNIGTRIRNVLRQTSTLRVDAGSLADHDDLYDAGLKSLAAVQLLLALEEEFGIEFPDSVLHRATFATVGQLRETIAALTAVSGLSPAGGL